MATSSNGSMHVYNFPLRINVGGNSYIDSNGNLWAADQYFVGGKVYSTQADVIDTENDFLYQSERSSKDLAYAIPVVNGTYIVNLSFAEIFFEDINKRVFDLQVEDQLVLDDFDIFETAGSANKLTTQSFQIKVEDGELNLDFLASLNNAKLSAIEVLLVPEPELISFDLQGRFSAEGIIPGGYFEGFFAYDLDTPDSLPEIDDVGIFRVSDFQVNIFDAEDNLVDVLTETNSLASVGLEDIDGADGLADQFIFSTTQDTSANENAVFEHGKINLSFDWLNGGSTIQAPEAPPTAFEQAFFSSFAATNSYEGIFNPQLVESATIAFSPVKFTLQGEFTDDGFLAGGYFEGKFSYFPDAPDKNPNITNVGTFDVDDFEINVFNADGDLIDSLTGENSSASVSLADVKNIDGVADQYIFSTTPDTQANENAFFEFGEFEFSFDWINGGSTDKAPIRSPQTLEDGSFSSFAAAGGFGGITDPQQIQTAAISRIHPGQDYGIESIDSSVNDFSDSVGFDI